MKTELGFGEKVFSFIKTELSSAEKVFSFIKTELSSGEKVFSLTRIKHFAQYPTNQTKNISPLRGNISSVLLDIQHFFCFAKV